MLHERIDLPVNYKGKISNSNQKPFITTYLLDNYENLDPNRLRPLIVICPGGGYEHLSVRESEAVAIKMNSLGFQAIILNYSLAPMEFPASLCDLAEAIVLARKKAGEWHVDPNKIVAAGFSAGGHLAATLGCYWNAGLLQELLPYQPLETKPNALLLSYPVITADIRYCHEASIRNVLGPGCEDERDFVSLENHVSKDVPPTFMWHTNEDKSVPAENSMFFANALRSAGINFEYHLFSKGIHGLALANEETSKPDGETVEKQCAIWPELFANWLETAF